MSTVIDAAQTTDDTLVADPGVNLMVSKDLNSKLQVVRGPDEKVDSALYLATGDVQVGREDKTAKFRVVAGLEAPGGENCSIEIAAPRTPERAKHFGVGNAEDYSWIQSYGLRPLYLNPIGNNVVIGKAPDTGLGCKVGINTTDPKADLDVNGALRATTLEVTGGFAIRGIKQIADAPDKGKLRALAFDPGTGTLYYV